jgi:hypothetical protein
LQAFRAQLCLADGHDRDQPVAIMKQRAAAAMASIDRAAAAASRAPAS